MTQTTIVRPPTREGWLEVRLGYANASSAAVYVGEHPFDTLEDLCVRRLTGGVVEENRAMVRGNRLEAAVADWWADEHGVAIYEPDVMFVNGRILATVDRGIVGNDKEGLEVKTCRKEVSEPERYWWWQVQAQMHCTDWERVHIACVDGSMDLKSFVVDRDQDAIDHLVERVEWVHSFLDLGLMPEGIELTAKHIAALHPEPEPTFVDADETAFQLAVRYEQCRRAAKDAEDALEDCKNALALVIGDHEGLAYDGRPLVSWKQQKRTSVDWKAVAKDHPDLLRKYERTTSFRSFRSLRDLAKELPDAD